jgi:hypothetical protein
MDWRCGSNSRVPALQVQNPSPTKKKRKGRKLEFQKGCVYAVRLFQIALFLFPLIYLFLKQGHTMQPKVLLTHGLP